MMKFLRYITFSTVALLAMAYTSSCTNKRYRVEKENLIPEEIFVSILSDSYIAGGLLSLPEIRYNFTNRDSVKNYIDIIEHYGFSYEDMDRTMKYYFISKPKKLIRIYDQIIRRMSEMESAIQNEIILAEKKMERERLYSATYFLPDPSGNTIPELDHKINPPGTYNLNFSITLFPDDLSASPGFSSYYVDADSVETGKKHWLPFLGYVKDGYPHQISLSGRIEGSRPLMLRTIFYDHCNIIREMDKHARIEFSLFSFITDPV
jgi:hypothetical protein